MDQRLAQQHFMFQQIEPARRSGRVGQRNENGAVPLEATAD
jgi:hypothetical protein